jgi:glycosyltransferase involved in cell wall biosynthesis
MEAKAVAPISVVIPCYRCVKTIDRAIRSILRQTVKPYEVILVDDASGDGTAEALNYIAHQYPTRVKVISFNHNQGVACARNAGWDLASQPYIAFLDADDAWHPRKLEIQYSYMLAHPDVTLSGHLVRVLDQPDSMPIWEIGSWDVLRLSKLRMLLTNRLFPSTVMLKRDVPNRFQSGKRHTEDHLLWLELLCAGHRLVKLNLELESAYKPLYGVGGLSSQLWLMEKGELDTYKSIYAKGHINFAQWIGLSLYSLTKYARRLLMYGLYLRWKK